MDGLTSYARDFGSSHSSRSTDELAAGTVCGAPGRPPGYAGFVSATQRVVPGMPPPPPRADTKKDMLPVSLHQYCGPRGRNSSVA